MSTVNFNDVVKETILAQWHPYQQQGNIKKDDLNEGITLLTKIAVKALSKENNEITTDKVRAFTQQNASRFLRICLTPFPFSTCHSETTLIALEKSLTDNSSILVHFFSANLSEEELSTLALGIKNLTSEAIGDACFHLFEAYENKRDNKAGYDLLWLIKNATGCDYTIPEKDSFTMSTVTEVLLRWMANPGTVENCVSFIEILLYQHPSLRAPLYHKLFDSKSGPFFVDFAFKQLGLIPLKNWPNKVNTIEDLVSMYMDIGLPKQQVFTLDQNSLNNVCKWFVEQLVNIPMDKWPNKGKIILSLFTTLSPEVPRFMADALSKSHDPKTAEIGRHLLEAVRADSLNEAIPHLNELVTLLPGFWAIDFTQYFGYPFPPFRELTLDKDPTCTRRLSFNEYRKVFVYQSLMIGVYDACIPFQDGTRFPSYLLAYDLESEKMVWGIPLTAKQLTTQDDRPVPLIEPSKVICGRNYFPPYDLEQVGNYIAIQLRDKLQVSLISSATGKLTTFTEKMPESIFCDWNRQFHISPEGYTYQCAWEKEKKVLIVGKIENGQWTQSFKAEDFGYGDFHSLSTHCGFHDKLEAKEYLIFGPTGDRKSIKNVAAVFAKGDKLFTIEEDPLNEKQSLLKVRTLKLDKEVVSDVEKSMTLNSVQVSFGDLCDNGRLILFSGNGDDSYPIFVNWKDGRVMSSTHKFYNQGRKIINPRKGEVWTLGNGVVSREIWKVSVTASWIGGSAESKQKMGSFQFNEDRTFLHVNDNDTLYFNGK